MVLRGFRRVMRGRVTRALSGCSVYPSIDKDFRKRAGKAFWAMGLGK